MLQVGLWEEPARPILIFLLSRGLPTPVDVLSHTQ